MKLFKLFKKQRHEVVKQQDEPKEPPLITRRITKSIIDIMEETKNYNIYECLKEIQRRTPNDFNF